VYTVDKIRPLLNFAVQIVATWLGVCRGHSKNFTFIYAVVKGTTWLCTYVEYCKKLGPYVQWIKSKH